MSDRLERKKLGKISYLTGGQGKNILFLHGIPGSAFTWETAANQLSLGYRVLIPDLLGFGSSEPPEGDYYLEAQAHQIFDFLHALNVHKLYLVAHDFGGPVGLTLMRLYPDLRIEGLVLSNTNLFTDTFIPPPLRLASNPILGPFSFKLMVGNRLALRLLYQAAVRQKNTASWEKFNRHLTPLAIHYTHQIFLRSLANLKLNYEAIENMLPGLRMPTLVLWGDADPFFSTKIADRVKAVIPDASLHIYKNTGHFVPEEQPVKLVKDVGDFINKPRI